MRRSTPVEFPTMKRVVCGENQAEGVRGKLSVGFRAQALDMRRKLVNRILDICNCSNFISTNHVILRKGEPVVHWLRCCTQKAACKRCMHPRLYFQYCVRMKAHALVDAQVGKSIKAVGIINMHPHSTITPCASLPRYQVSLCEVSL
jgi:hypothetical protein